MQRPAIILLALTFILPAFAQDTRVFVVRDDDGTADEGRGQVSSQNSVCGKTLILDRDPAEVETAWVQYYMKVNPYDVETKKLYGAPAEGVTWPDLVITVNGTEILREPLIDVGTMGWHEAQFDEALLQPGENFVAITLSEPGAYFYLGIDRDNDYGRSASSRDGGNTWRESWLSFTTEEPDGGEYMVRLKYEAPEAEQIAFIERDGRYSGWLEMEDLFSATEAHASGFKAIEWTRGANQPSGDMVAYNAQGRVSFPLEIPADRQWKLWMRAWTDGFRNGSFTLSVDGRPFYDSTGHEFTSDTNLRLDWLDMGVIHLGEGTHTFEIVTEGECGHFFDVFVLTTDMGYVPDEADPLPRMTVASLVAAPGLSDLQPGLYMTSNPIAWAKPLAGGPLRTLWVCGDINQREVVELQQRMDLQANAVSSHVSYLGNNVFGQELSLDQADAIYERLTGRPPLDVIVLVRAKLDQLPEHAMQALLERVEEGAGLIVVRSRRDEQPTALGALLEETEPLDVSTLAAPISLSPLDRPTVREHGAGRIISVPYSLWGTLNRLDPPAHTLRYPYWEYQFAVWINLLMTAAGRDAAQVATVSVPATVAPGEPPAVTVTLAGEAASLRATWLPPFGEPTLLEPVPVAGDTASIALPASNEDGLHHVALTLTDPDGAAVGIASAFYEVRRPTRITEVLAECAEAGSTVIGMIAMDGPDQLLVQAQVIGAHGRLLGSAEGTVTDGAELRVPLIASHERLIELRLTVPGDDGPAQRIHTLLTRPQPVVLDDYMPYSGVWENVELPEYAASAYLRVWEDIGIRAIQPSGIVWHSLDQGFSTAHPYRLTSAGNGTVDAEGVRTPCLHDPEVLAAEEPSIRETVSRLRAFSPVLLGLGDEQSIGNTEACFSDHTIGAFREWLRDRYASLDELNALWQTDFAAWEAVEPWRLAQAKQRPENLAPWLEFREFMAHTFVESTRTMQSWAQEEADDTLIGGVNPWDEGWTTCTVMSKLFPVLQYGQIYPRSHDRARSWFRDPRLIGTWSGYSRPQAQIEREGWLLPTYGGTFMGWYGVGRQLGYGTFTSTIDLGDRAKWISRVNHELNSGVGKLLIESEQAQEPVAILHSWPSRCAYIAAMGAEEPDTPADALDQRWDECEETFVRLLKALRIPYVFVDEDQVADGHLQEREVECLIAPRAWALSDEALDAIAAFAAEQPVIADSGLGRYDELGHARAEAPIDAIDATVWDDLPAPVSDDNLARLRAPIDAVNVMPGADALRGDVSFIVSRKLGELEILVAFGAGALTVDLPQPIHMYDAREHRSLGLVTQAAAQMEHGPAVLIGSRGAEIAGLGIGAQGGALGKTVRYDLSLASGNDTVAHVTVIGPDGEERAWYAANVRIAEGSAAGSFTPALNDPAGAWTIRALDIITGETAEVEVEVGG